MQVQNTVTVHVSEGRMIQICHCGSFASAFFGHRFSVKVWSIYCAAWVLGGPLDTRARRKLGAWLLTSLEGAKGLTNPCYQSLLFEHHHSSILIASHPV